MIFHREGVIAVYWDVTPAYRDDSDRREKEKELFESVN